MIRQRDGSFLADARTSIEEVVATLGAEFDIGDAAEEVDTLGGYLVTKVGRVPVRGELVPGPDDFEIEVVDADPRRVKKVRIYRRKSRVEADRQARRAAKPPVEIVQASVPGASADAGASPPDPAHPSSEPTS